MGRKEALGVETVEGWWKPKPGRSTENDRGQESQDRSGRQYRGRGGGHCAALFAFLGSWGLEMLV